MVDIQLGKILIHLRVVKVEDVCIIIILGIIILVILGLIF